MMRAITCLLLAACGGTAAPVANTGAPPAPTGPSYRIDRTTIDGETLGEIIDLQPLGPSYYKVYLTSGEGGAERCAMVPRPDGDLAAACKKREPLGDIARRNGLCNVPVSQHEFVERVNQMPIDDCLTIKRSLERALRFEASADGSGAWAVWPFPAKRDVQKICARQDRGGLSAELCEFWSPEHTTEEMRFFSEDQTKLLAKRLNELYGK